MNKMFLVLRREYMSRVKKKSFLLSTLLVPLIFPLLIGGMIYFAIQNDKNKSQEKVRILDESGLFEFTENSAYAYEKVAGPLDSAKAEFTNSSDFALLYIPEIEIENPEGILFYTHSSPGLQVVGNFESNIWRQVKDIKLSKMGLSKAQMDSLETRVDIQNFNVSETGEESKSSTGSTFGTGYVMGFLIYMFLFIFGAQVMQGVIEEKNSKIVEVVVSTLKPFQMMLGKVLGVAAVGATQFVIWIVVMSVLSTVVLAIFGLSLDPAEMQKMAEVSGEDVAQANERVQAILSVLSEINITQTALLFLFYFIGGYLLYGALFAAVGSAVDTPADAQQFMMPIMLPIIAALMALIFFVFNDPHGPASFWLSIIPFTSPIVMMGRIGFGVPTWEIILSMALLIAGFFFTLWIAGRIYRVGILMHGTKVNYKTLFRWFMQK